MRIKTTLMQQNPTTAPANANTVTGTALEAVASVAVLSSESTTGAVALVVVLEVVVLMVVVVVTLVLVRVSIVIVGASNVCTATGMDADAPAWTSSLRSCSESTAVSALIEVATPMAEAACVLGTWKVYVVVQVPAKRLPSSGCSRRDSTMFTRTESGLTEYAVAKACFAADVAWDSETPAAEKTSDPSTLSHSSVVVVVVEVVGVIVLLGDVLVLAEGVLIVNVVLVVI
mmetsp:Transcript_80876/g.208237  ORF Transcript_80876/g.208237 Transcript_80876/m.208237 type:complete len:230 (-) Transcript_80876:103-792(-)